MSTLTIDFETVSQLAEKLQALLSQLGHHTVNASLDQQPSSGTPVAPPVVPEGVASSTPPPTSPPAGRPTMQEAPPLDVSQPSTEPALPGMNQVTPIEKPANRKELEKEFETSFLAAYNKDPEAADKACKGLSEAYGPKSAQWDSEQLKVASSQLQAIATL